MRPEIFGFYFITDSKYTRQGALKDAGDAIMGGAGIVQYREKDLLPDDMMGEAKQLAELCRGAGVIFIINDDAELAREVGADGVHIGPRDMPLRRARKIFPDGIIGVSCSTVAEVVEAEKGGADYIAASPVFFTLTKSFKTYDIARSLGMRGIAAFRRATDLPIVAIGGIKLENVAEAIAAGADAACAISATVGTENVEESVREFVDKIESARIRRARTQA